MLPHLKCFFCHSTLKIYSYKNLFWAELNYDGHFKVCISRKISSAHNIYRLRLFTSYPALFATGYVFGGISKILISKSVLARFCQNFPSRTNREFRNLMNHTNSGVWSSTLIFTNNKKQRDFLFCKSHQNLQLWFFPLFPLRPWSEITKVNFEFLAPPKIHASHPDQLDKIDIANAIPG